MPDGDSNAPHNPHAGDPIIALIERYKQGAAAVVLEKDGVRTIYAFVADDNGQTKMLAQREKNEDEAADDE